MIYHLNYQRVSCFIYFNIKEYGCCLSRLPKRTSLHFRTVARSGGCKVLGPLEKRVNFAYALLEGLEQVETDYVPVWWFGTFFIFPYMGNNHHNHPN